MIGVAVAVAVGDGVFVGVAVGGIETVCIGNGVLVGVTVGVAVGVGGIATTWVDVGSITGTGSTGSGWRIHHKINPITPMSNI